MLLFSTYLCGVEEELVAGVDLAPAQFWAGLGLGEVGKLQRGRKETCTALRCSDGGPFPLLSTPQHLEPGVGAPQGP